MKIRTATRAEIIADIETRRRHGRSQYAHYVRETLNLRATNGVSHRSNSSARFRIQDGVPVVHKGGRLVYQYMKNVIGTNQDKVCEITLAPCECLRDIPIPGFEQEQ